MFALRRAKRILSVRSRVGEPSAPFSAAGFVLPRMLRRPVRTIGRLFKGEVKSPRYAVGILNAGLLAATGLYGIYVGGHTPEVLQSITARTGFAVDQVKVIGNRETSEIDVLDRLQLDGWTSLVGMNAGEARDRIASLPWVAQVSVRKTYPDMIEVKLEERKPFAIWQQNKELNVIEASGNVIAPFRGGSMTKLPMVVGEGAEKAAAAFVTKVEAFPELAHRARVYIRVAARRWDIKFESGVIVKLPEFGVEQALQQLDAMDRQSSVLSKDIASLDMRLSDRVVVRLTAEAQERREAELKNKPEAMKAKAEKKRT